MNKLVVVITPYFLTDEASLTELLFTEEILHLHLRKLGRKHDELEGLLNKISPAYYDRVVLHDWFTLTEERALEGTHLNRGDPGAPPLYKGNINRSCHNPEEVTRCRPIYDYMFLNPIFQSISEERYGGGFSLDRLRSAKGIIDDKVTALGEICPRMVTELKNTPFGGVAILGALWGDDPSLLIADQFIKQFKRLQVWPQIIISGIMGMEGSVGEQPDYAPLLAETTT